MSEHDPATEAPADESAEADEPTGPEPELLHDCIVAESLGQTVVHPTRDQYPDLMKALADDGYAMIVDLCGVDYLDHMSRPLPEGVDRERFEVVVNMLDIAHRRRIRVRVQLPDAEPTVASLCDLHPGAEAYEREAFDMFGIVFDDHPDLTRILMPEDWIGHPLRKDYDAGRIPVQFKGAHA